jgi:hypothetical protein
MSSNEPRIPIRPDSRSVAVRQEDVMAEVQRERDALHAEIERLKAERDELLDKAWDAAGAGFKEQQAEIERLHAQRLAEHEQYTDWLRQRDKAQAEIERLRQELKDCHRSHRQLAEGVGTAALVVTEELTPAEQEIERLRKLHNEDIENAAADTAEIERLRAALEYMVEFFEPMGTGRIPLEYARKALANAKECR